MTDKPMKEWIKTCPILPSENDTDFDRGFMLGYTQGVKDEASKLLEYLTVETGEGNYLSVDKFKEMLKQLEKGQ